MKKMVLDLHDIYNRGEEITRALNEALLEAERKNVKKLEIIPGKGSGQLKKRVLKFLERNRSLYKRIDKPPGNWGHLYVWMR